MKRRYFPLQTNSCRFGSLFVNCWIPPVVEKTEGYGKSSTTPQKDGGTAVPSHKRRRRVGVNLLAWSWGCPSFSFLRGVAFSRLQEANPKPQEGRPTGWASSKTKRERTGGGERQHDPTRRRENTAPPTRRRRGNTTQKERGERRSHQILELPPKHFMFRLGALPASRKKHF